METTLDDDNWPSMERDVSFKLLAPVELEWRTELSVRSDSISEKNANRISLVPHLTGPSPIGSHCPLIDPAPRRMISGSTKGHPGHQADPLLSMRYDHEQNGTVG